MAREKENQEMWPNGSWEKRDFIGDVIEQELLQQL